MSDFAKYPRESEAWLECSVCGLDFPTSQMMRHYKTKKFVDRRCNDREGRTDLWGDFNVRPEDIPMVSPQRVDTVGGALPPGSTIQPGGGGGYGGGGYGAGGYGDTGGEPPQGGMDPSGDRGR